tara:strand:- start:349 stop:552 length:204 start_codon:yes stop_codon:yes gene_type:complete
MMSANNNENTKIIKNEIVENEKIRPINNRASPKPKASLKLDFSFSLEYKNTISNSIEMKIKFIPIDT